MRAPKRRGLSGSEGRSKGEPDHEAGDQDAGKPRAHGREAISEEALNPAAGRYDKVETTRWTR